jgi:hypothetical protein
MSGMRAVTSTISNAASTIAIAQWENACDRAVLDAELSLTPKTFQSIVREQIR